MINFKDFEAFLENFSLKGEILNNAFSLDVSPCESQQNSEAENLLENRSAEERSAQKFYQLLMELKSLFDKDKIFTSYALINWMKIYLSAINDENKEIQEILRKSALHMFDGVHSTIERTARWNHYAMITYTGLAIVGFLLTLSIMISPQLAEALEAQEKIFSFDIASDMLLNTVEGIASVISTYHQWTLGEYGIASFNSIGAAQTLLCTLIGISIGVNSIIRYGFQCEETQEAIEIAGKILSIACALGMFFSARVEYLEYDKSKRRKNKLIALYLQDKEFSVDTTYNNTLSQTRDPIQLLNTHYFLNKNIVLNVLLDEAPQDQTNTSLENKEKLLTTCMAIEQAQANNNLRNTQILIVYGLMMGMFTACEFFPIIADTLTPMAIQSLVFVTAILGYYFISKYDNVKKLQDFLVDATHPNGQPLANDTGDHSCFSSIKANIQFSIDYVQKQLFYQRSTSNLEGSYQKLMDQSDIENSEGSGVSYSNSQNITKQ